MNHFLSGHVPDRKYISGCKCGFRFPTENEICAQQTAKSWRKSPKGFFDKLRSCSYEQLLSQSRKYRASVSNNIFLSSLSSSDIKSRSNTTIRSPVSRFFGRRFLRKHSALHRSDEFWDTTGGAWGGFGSGWPGEFAAFFCWGGRVCLSGTALLRKLPSDCGIYRLYIVYLPVRSWMLPFSRKADAIFASFAARMAFSSFWILS